MNPEHDEKAWKMAQMFILNGYRFYDIEESRRSALAPPKPIPRDEVSFAKRDSAFSLICM